MNRGEPRAGDQPSRPRTDAFLRSLGRLVLSVFFRRIEVVGAERFPAEGPVVVVANHFNSIVDGALITTYLPRMPRLLAASIVWQNKPLVPLMDAAGVIPVIRQQDAEVDLERNVETFAKTWDLLAAGGVLALFPEGMSHSEPFLLPTKTGAARIVLESEEFRGPLGVKIVPVGLVFDSKSKFRSRVLLQIGDPVDLAQVLEAYRQGSEEARREAVRELTVRIRDGLTAVTLNYGSWEEARLIARAAALWGRPRPDLPTKAPLAETFEMRRDFLEGYEWMRNHHPQRTATVRAALVEYDALLTGARLRDEQVGAAYPTTSVLGFVGRSAFALLVRLNLAVVGTVLNWPPYRIAQLVGGRVAPEQMATWMIFPSLVIFPAFWLLEALTLGSLAAGWQGPGWGISAGIAVFLAAPVTGRVALTFHDVRRRLVHEARAWLLLRTRKRLTEHLAEKRQEVLEQLDALVALYRREFGSR